MKTLQNLDAGDLITDGTYYRRILARLGGEGELTVYAVSYKALNGSVDLDELKTGGDIMTAYELEETEYTPYLTPEDKYPKTELFEKLAAIEHERWADWQRYVHSNCIPCTDGLVIPANLVEHWGKQMDAYYSDLSEAEKDSDRKQVMRYWELIVPSEDKTEKLVEEYYSKATYPIVYREDLDKILRDFAKDLLSNK